MSDLRDTQHGVNDPVEGVGVERDISQNETPHERAQGGADVRSMPAVSSSEPFLPERLRRGATDPLNARTGLKPTD